MYNHGVEMICSWLDRRQRWGILYTNNISVASACLITKSWAQNILSKIIYNNNLNFLSWISFFRRSPPLPAHQKIKVVYGKEMGYGGVVLVVWHCTATKSCTLQDQFCFSGSFSTQEGSLSVLIRPCLVLQLWDKISEWPGNELHKTLVRK